MNTSTALKTGFAIAVAYFGSTACVARECTAEEQQEVGATGADECTTYTPPQPHEGKAKTKTLEYTAGGDLRIQGDFRNLEIEAFPGGGTGEVEVEWKPRVDLAQGRSDEQVEATLEELDVKVSESGGNITVTATRSGKSNVAALIQVRIPDDFDGDVTIEQNGSKNDGGEAELSFLANAKVLKVDMNASCDQIVVKGGDLEVAQISGNGFCDIKTATFKSPNFNGAALSTDSGNIETGFATVPDANDVKLISEDGDITVRLPDGGDYVFRAASPNFDFKGGVPPFCEDRENEGGASMTCNAGADTITFDLSTDGAIVVSGYEDYVE